jgi:phosphohistidine phosphatase SixA
LSQRIARLFRPERIVSSPFTRALQTAEIVARTREKYLEAYARLLGKPAPFA